MMNTLTVPQMADQLTAGRLMIRVPDFGDPCGMRKISREVSAAYRNGAEWCVAFAGTYLRPAILRTTESRAFEVTSDGPGQSGPCDGCKACADQLATEKAAEQARTAAVERAMREREAEAIEAGRQAGYGDAMEEDVNGTPIPDVRVPAWCADLASHYESGHGDGVEQYGHETAE